MCALEQMSTSQSNTLRTTTDAVRTCADVRNEVGSDMQGSRRAGPICLEEVKPHCIANTGIINC
jgi:hypothetical protein